jgi:hypothetical protein
MEPTEEDSLLSKLLHGMNSRYQTTQITVGPTAAEWIKEALDQVVAPPLTTIHADLTKDAFHYDEDASTLVTKANAFGRRLYEYSKGKYTEITLYNPKTGNIVNFVWSSEFKHPNDDICYHLYSGWWNNARVWLKVYKTGVKKVAP